MNFKDIGIELPGNDDWSSHHSEHDAKRRFLTQAFTGLCWYLNDNWLLSAGYRLRYVPCDFRFFDDDGYGQLAKFNCTHAAEVGLTYRF